MKPTIQTVERENSRKNRRNFPVTDYNYQSLALGGLGGRCARRCEPGFHTISRDYFRTEDRQYFLAEAGIFIAIMCSAALPLLSGANAVLSLVRVFGGF